MEGRHVDPLGAAYAEALAQVVEAEGGVDLLREVGQRMRAFGRAWLRDRTLRAFFLSAEVSDGTKTRAVQRLAAEQPRALGNFLRLLLRRGRISLLAEVAEAYEAFLDRRLGRVPVTLTTATEVPADRLAGWVARIRDATGREPVFRHVLKPEILAGAVVQVGDSVADGSARRRLAELRRRILERGKHAFQA